MSGYLRDDPEHWRKRAEEVLTLAEREIAPQSKLLLLDLVAGYEKLAQQAESRIEKNQNAWPTIAETNSGDRTSNIRR